MAVLLWILKIIGILLSVILTLVLLILFVPVTYAGRMQADDKNLSAGIRAGWLFHAVHFGWKYEEGETLYVIRILGIPVYPSKQKDKEQKSVKSKKTNSRDEYQKSEEHKTDISKDDFKEDTENKETVIKENLHKSADKKKREDNFKENKTKNSSADKKTDIFTRCRQFAENIKSKVINALHNIKGTCDKAKEIKNFVSANTTKEAYNYGKRMVIKLLRHISPSKIRADIRMGFEQPHITGQVLGYTGMIYAALNINPKHIVIEPDFENKVFDGKIKVRGHVVIFVAGLYILKFYFNKEIHDIIKKFS